MVASQNLYMFKDLFSSTEKNAAKKLKKFEEYLSKEEEYLSELSSDIGEEYAELMAVLDKIKNLKNLCLSILNRLSEVKKRMESDISLGDTIDKWKVDFQELKEELQELERMSEAILSQEKKQSTVEQLVKKVIQKAEKTIYEAEQTEKEWFK
jgi:DNA repair ATPase RecN